MDFLLLLVLLGVVFLLLLLLAKRNYSYWERNGVTQLNPELFYGDLRDMLSGHVPMGSAFANFYNIFKQKNLPFGGVYWAFTPMFIPVDVQLIKAMLVKDFAYFQDRGSYHHENDILSQNLFRLPGEQWRNLRQKLSPTFTSSRMRMMFETMQEKIQQLDPILDRCIQKGEINVTDVSACLTTDVIASCAFGIECNSLQDPDCQLRQQAKRISIPMPLKQWVENTVPRKLLGYTGFKAFPGQEAFFRKLVLDTMAYREKNVIYRKDFMHLLLQLRNKGELTDDGNFSKNQSQKGILTDDEIIAQCFIFFTAGFDTSSSTMAFAMHELALQPDLQDRVRDEVLQVFNKYDGNITYLGTQELVLTGRVIAETLRKYPVLANIPRICTKDYKIPNSNVVLKKGTQIQLPVWGLHMDPEYFPDPHKFDPDRFSEEAKATRPEFAYFPFGEGPRICIGARFAQIEAKLGLAALLRKGKFSVLPGKNTTLKFKPSMVLLHATEEIRLKVEKR
uniref:Cytochrome P450 n=1 Tax=Dendroctonus armandi TaxID=77159 RepID=A0A0M4HBP7_9CUCU|nr:cytochrome P450 [Dendroctonus armandi]